jgi:hypothetical protein
MTQTLARALLIATSILAICAAHVAVAQNAPAPAAAPAACTDCGRVQAVRLVEE